MTTTSIQDLMAQIEKDRALALPDASKLGDFILHGTSEHDAQSN